MKKNQILFTVVCSVYIVAGAIAVFCFSANGSYLSRRQSASVTTETSTFEEPDVPVTSNEPDTSTEPDTSVSPDKPDTLTESDTSVSPDEPDAPVTPDEPDTPTKPDISEEVTPADDDADTVVEDKTYYKFTVIDGVSGVRIRETEDRNSTTVSYIDGGKSGYVLEKGDTRSKILTKKGTIGYIYNEYITFSEISGKNFPKEYR